MKKILALIALLATVNACHGLTTHYLTLDTAKQLDSFELVISRGSTPNVRASLYNNYEAETNLVALGLGSYIYYAENAYSTQGVFITASETNAAGYFEYQFDSNQSLGLSTNNEDYPITYFCQVVVTNDSSKVYDWSQGKMKVRPSGAVDGVANIVLAGQEADPLSIRTNDTFVNLVWDAPNRTLIAGASTNTIDSVARAGVTSNETDIANLDVRVTTNEDNRDSDVLRIASNEVNIATITAESTNYLQRSSGSNQDMYAAIDMNQNSIVDVFSVEAGTVQATTLQGNGSGVVNVDAETLDGYDSTFFINRIASNEVGVAQNASDIDDLESGATNAVQKTGDIMSGSLATHGDFSAYIDSGDDSGLIVREGYTANVANDKDQPYYDYTIKQNITNPEYSIGGWYFPNEEDDVVGILGGRLGAFNIESCAMLLYTNTVQFRTDDVQVFGRFVVVDSQTNEVAWFDENGAHIGTNSFIVDTSGNITEVGNVNLDGNTISNGHVLVDYAILDNEAVPRSQLYELLETTDAGSLYISSNLQFVSENPEELWEGSVALSDGTNEIATIWTTNRYTRLRAGSYTLRAYGYQSSGNADIEVFFKVVWSDDDLATTNEWSGNSSMSGIIGDDPAPFLMFVDTYDDIVGTNLALGIIPYAVRSSGTQATLVQAGGNGYPSHLDTPGFGSISGYVEEAPSNGVQYVRQDESWTEVSAAGVSTIPLNGSSALDWGIIDSNMEYFRTNGNTYIACDNDFYGVSGSLSVGSLSGGNITTNLFTCFADVETTNDIVFKFQANKSGDWQSVTNPFHIMTTLTTGLLDSGFTVPSGNHWYRWEIPTNATPNTIYINCSQPWGQL